MPSAFEEAAARKSNSVVEDPLDALGQKVAQLQRHVKSIEGYTNDLGTSREGAHTRRRLKNDRADSDRVVADIREKLTGLRSTYVSKSQEEKRRYERMHTQFTNLATEFASLRKLSIEKEKKSAKPGTGGPANRLPPGEDEEEGGHEGMMAQGLVRKQYDVSTLHTERAVQQEKLDEFRELAGELDELHGMYKDFRVLAEEQSELVTESHDYVVQANQSVSKGVVEIHKAGEYQKSSRKKMCCIIVIIIIIVIVAIIAITLGVKLG